MTDPPQSQASGSGGDETSNGHTSTKENEPIPVVNQVEVRVRTASEAKRRKLVDVNKHSIKMATTAVGAKKKRRSKIKPLFLSQVCFHGNKQLNAAVYGFICAHVDVTTNPSRLTIASL